MSIEDKDCNWTCDNCGTYMNSQPGFTTITDEWKCKKCGFINDVSVNNIVDYYEDDFDDNYENEYDDDERISIFDAASIWASSGKDPNCTFGYSEDELEDAFNS